MCLEVEPVGNKSDHFLVIVPKRFFGREIWWGFKHRSGSVLFCYFLSFVPEKVVFSPLFIDWNFGFHEISQPKLSNWGLFSLLAFAFSHPFEGKKRLKHEKKTW